MELSKIIKERRSIRKFDATKNVTDEEINKILEAGIWAPSAGNTQCWRFFAVRDKKVKEELAVKAGHQPFICDAPVLIVVCADLRHIEKSYGSRGSETYALQDTAAAVQNMLLTIADMGLASCWIGAFDEGKAAAILKVAEGWRTVAMLPVGHAAIQTPKAPPRRTLDEVVTRV